MNSIKKLLLLYPLTMVCLTQAQATKFYSTEQGLSNSSINQIYQDKKGFIWITTENGLNRFDGVRFTVYKKSSGDSAALKSNHINTPDTIKTIFYKNASFLKK